MDYNTGICKLVFKPDHSDLGKWTCTFTLTNEDTDIEIGSATLVLLNTLAGLLTLNKRHIRFFIFILFYIFTSFCNTKNKIIHCIVTDEKLGWIVGALTAMILFLMIIVVVLVVCKARIFVRKTSEVLETLPSNENKQRAKFRDESYTENQGKLNLQFTEDSRTSSLKSVLPDRSPRLQDRMEKIHAMPSKEFENVGM